MLRYLCRFKAQAFLCSFKGSFSKKPVDHELWVIPRELGSSPLFAVNIRGA